MSTKSGVRIKREGSRIKPVHLEASKRGGPSARGALPPPLRPQAEHFALMAQGDRDAPLRGSARERPRARPPRLPPRLPWHGAAASKRASKQASEQASKQASEQASKQASEHASKRASSGTHSTGTERAPRERRGAERGGREGEQEGRQRQAKPKKMQVAPPRPGPASNRVRELHIK